MTVFVSLLSYLGLVSCLVWSLVEFILYLVKDHEFNWWSLYLIPVFLVSMFISFIAVVRAKKEDELFKYGKPSKFEQKLKEMQELKTKNNER